MLFSCAVPAALQVLASFLLFQCVPCDPHLLRCEGVTPGHCAMERCTPLLWTSALIVDVRLQTSCQHSRKPAAAFNVCEAQSAYTCRHLCC